MKADALPWAFWNLCRQTSSGNTCKMLKELLGKLGEFEEPEPALATSTFPTGDEREKLFTTYICPCRWVFLRAKVLSPGICRMVWRLWSRLQEACQSQHCPARWQSAMTTEQLLCKLDISSNLRGIHRQVFGRFSREIWPGKWSVFHLYRGSA